MATSKQIAESVYAAAVHDGYEPTGLKLMADYSLTPARSITVKDRVARLAAEDGAFWGYLPSQNRYVLAPEIGGDAQRAEMFEYYAKQASKSVKRLLVYVRAGEVGGYIPSAIAAAERDKMNEAATKIRRTPIRVNMTRLKKVA